MKMSGGITVFQNDDPSNFETITVIFKEDSLDVEKISTKAGVILYEDEDTPGD